MASARYTLNIDPEDLKPEPPRQLTPKEKRANWWHYNWKFVVAGVVALLIVGMLVKDIVFRTDPDYRIGIVTQYMMPDEVALSLGDALAPFGEDLNGDGQVLVDVTTYTVALGEHEEHPDDPAVAIDMEMMQAEMIAGQTRLSADVQTRDVMIFLCDKPRDMQKMTGMLSSVDGVLPENPDDPEMPGVAIYPWSSCPVLTGLELADYTSIAGSESIPGQQLMQNLYLVRRGFTEERPMANEEGPANQALFEKLIEGATVQ